MSLTKNKLCYDPVADKGDQVKSFIVDSSGDALESTAGSLNVNLTGSTGSIEVTATDLDIRDLTDGSGNTGFDQVRIGDGVENLAINPDGSINVNNTDQGPIRFIDNTATVVAVEEDTAPLPVKLQGLGGDINVTAGDLNVQLDHTGATFDSTRIGDGTELAAITTNSDLQVVDRANSGILVTQDDVAFAAPANLLASNLAERKHIFIQNASMTEDLEIGQTGFTKGQGFIIPCGNTFDMSIGPNVTIQGVGAGTVAVDTRILELA